MNAFWHQNLNMNRIHQNFYQFYIDFGFSVYIVIIQRFPKLSEKKFRFFLIAFDGETFFSQMQMLTQWQALKMFCALVYVYLHISIFQYIYLQIYWYGCIDTWWMIVNIKKN